MRRTTRRWSSSATSSRSEVFTLARAILRPDSAQGAAARASRRTSRRSAGSQQLTVKAPAELPYVLMAFRAPVLRDPEKDWEPYALEMLANVLDGNEAARLNRTLVRSERIGRSAGRELRRRRPRARACSI